MSMSKNADGWGSTFIQWKGTDVCIDIVCPCGASFHYDGDFLYSYLCPACGNTYVLGTEVTLTPITADYASAEPRTIDPSAIDEDDD